MFSMQKKIKCNATIKHKTQLLQKFLQSLQFQPLVGNSLIIFGSITFKNMQISYQNLIFVAETHVYTKASSATMQRAFSIQISN